MNSILENNIWIIGCGDIGRRLVKLYTTKQRKTITGVVLSNESADACRSMGIRACQHNFDKNDNGLELTSANYLTLSPEQAEIKSSNIYYFLPPPPEGKVDSRIQLFLANLDSTISITARRIVLISTTGVYGDSQGEWIDESTPTNPKADRAFRRLSAERALKNWAEKTGGEYIILRVPGIYAEDRLPLDRIKKGLPVVNENEAGWTNRIHADDLAHACKAAMECNYSNQIINVCDGNPSTMTDYFNQVADYANLSRPLQISLKEAEKTLSAGMVSYLKESRRISNSKMLKLLDISLKYPDLASFLRNVHGITSRSITQNF